MQNNANASASGPVAVQTVTLQLGDAGSQTVVLTTGSEQQSGSKLKLILPTLAPADDVTDDEKKKLYKHPLLPLLTLLLERCEKATQSPDSASTDSFNSELNEFLLKSNKDMKTTSGDAEIDNLMLKTIQVLRIHLLELEKVNELCKDFCSRYIACLKGKLQSQTILREAGVESDDGSSENDEDDDDRDAAASRHHRRGRRGDAAVSAASAYGPGHIVSGGTVYQMVQTPQGLVAQPIMVPPHPAIHGSTPLSQIGAAHLPDGPASQLSDSRLYSADSDGSDDDYQAGGKKLKRGTLSKHATQVMKSWLFQHIVHPYPTEEEKKLIGQQTNLTLTQVNNWFINARRRILQPMLDASNPEGVKAKKSKPQSRPAQRFWPESLANISPQVARQIGSSGAASKASRMSVDSPPAAASPGDNSNPASSSSAASKPVTVSFDSVGMPTTFLGVGQPMPVLTMDGSQPAQPVFLAASSAGPQVQLVQTSMGLLQLLAAGGGQGALSIQLPGAAPSHAGAVALMVAPEGRVKAAGDASDNDNDGSSSAASDDDGK